MSMYNGLYDPLMTEGIASRFDPTLADVLALTQGGADILAEAITRQLAAILDELPGDDAGKAGPPCQRSARHRCFCWANVTR